MKQNTIITLGLGAIVYYLWSRGNKPNTNEVIHQTKPMYLEDGAKPFLEEGRPLLPSELPLQNSINLPNLGIPWKDRVPTSDFSNIGGRKRRKKYDKAEDKMLAYCRRHPDSPQCIGLDWGQ